MENLLAGQVLEGRYRIVSRLAVGGMATIYVAEHTLIGRAVAIKVLHPQYAVDAEHVQRFLAEGRTAGTLGHPHIVESTDMGYTEGGAPYLVLELLEGRGLNDVIRGEGRVPIDRAVAIALQIASALTAAHARGIIHRDLKSDNIFLVARPGGGDHVKVLDFGISKFTEQSGHTQRDRVLGTPWFMPPEQVEDPSSVDARCDVYALGAILYEMLAGQVPFADSQFPQVLVKILSEEPQPIESLCPDIRPELAAVLRAAMARSLDRRTASMAELGRALAAAVGRAWPETPGPARAVSVPAPPRPGRPRAVIAGVTAAVLAGAGIGVAVALWPRAADGPAPAGEADDSARAASRPAAPTGQAAPTTQAAPAGPAAPAKTAAPAGAEATAPTAPAAATGTVELAITSTTRGARVTLRGETYRLPMHERLPRRDRPEPIEVSAPGHATRRSWVTLDRDRTLPLEPERSRRGATARREPDDIADASRRGPAAVSPSPAGSSTESSTESSEPEPQPRPEPADAKPTAPPAREEPPPRRTVPAPPAQPATARPPPGTMDRQATRDAVGRHLPEIRTCFERGRMDNPQLAGRVLVRIAVSPTGKVTSASVSRSDVRSQLVESCIVSAIERWTLPAPAGGAAATITYPFSYH
ncbi:MAG TPA: TonB family protein [Kofleriaceae bacterium]|nr:TonB family protein [Kofleriaceae bacterium]